MTNSIIVKNRNHAIDIAKAVGIFLVVLGHHPDNLTNWIYSFHMPLFFLLSGIFHKKYDCYKSFIKKKVKTLLIPYFIFSIILIFVWYIIGRKYGEAALHPVTLKQSILGMLYGSEVKDIASMQWGGTLWFLPCLFIVENLFYFISKLKKEKVFVLILLSMSSSIVYNLLFTFNLPWNIQRALFEIGFYSVGYYYKDFFLETTESKARYMIFGVFALFLNLLVFSVFKVNDQVISKVIYFFTGLFGSVGIIELCKVYKTNKFIDQIGKNTIILFCLERKVNAAIKFIIIIILHKNMIEGNIAIDVIYSIIQILLCYPLIVVINKYFYFILGRKKS